MVIEIARSTFRESIRSKILYLVIFFAAAVVAVGTLFGKVAVQDYIKIVKDFGFFAMSVVANLFAIIAGTTLLHKELSRRTVLTVLSKPMPRWKFVVGKYFGLLSTAAVILLIMAVALSAYISFLLWELDTSSLIFASYVALEVAIISATAIFFSSLVVTIVLAGMFTFVVYLAGRSIEFINIMSEDVTGIASNIVSTIYWALPHLTQLNIANELVYSIYPTAEHFLLCVAYATSYSAVLLAIATLIFSRRQFNL